MIINHNMAALNTYRQLSSNNSIGAKSLEKLSSGLRINRAGDDAAGLAISEKMRGQIRGLDQASRNAQDGISLIQTAEGSLNETHSILQRMRELAVQSANDTTTSSDRAEIQKEVDELAKEITRISNTSEFNTKNLLAGGFDSTFHIGANANQSISLSINAMDAYSLGVAGSTIVQSGFAANGSGISGVANFGQGFATSSNYNIDVAITDAAYAAGGAIADSVVTGAMNVTSGDVAITDETAYTGAQDANYLVKVSNKSADNVSEIAYSTDNGTSWSFASVAAGAVTVDGMEMTFTNGTGAADYTIGDTYTFSVTAKTASLQLQDGATNIGSAVTVRSGQTSATIGDTSANETLTASFAFASLADATSATFTLTSNSSTAAVTSNGAVTSDAVTRAGIAVNTQSAANTAITSIETAIETVSSERAKLGAYQNRLEHTISNLGTSSENMTAAESRIRDVDMAKEMMNYTKMNILSQAATAMLAQANQQPQGVLQLLQ